MVKLVIQNVTISLSIGQFPSGRLLTAWVRTDDKTMKYHFAALSVALSCLISVSARADDKPVAETARSFTVKINSSSDGSLNGGSGFIISRQGNTYKVLSANHVVCQDVQNRSPADKPGYKCSPGSYTVTTPSGQEHQLTIEHNYQRTHGIDLALTSFNSSESLAVATLGDSNYIEQASTVYPTGYSITGFGVERNQDFRASEGFIVSKLVEVSDGYSLQYAAKTGVGMSGGPVLDIDQRVIGIHGGGIDTPETRNSEILQSEVEGFKAAIPINVFERICKEANNCPELTFNRSEPSEDPAERLRNPESARDYYAKGLVMHGNHQYSTAESLYDEAIRINDAYADAYRHRGLAKVKQRRYQEAISDWTRAIELGYATAEIYHHRGLAYLRLKDIASAEADYRQALKLNYYYGPLHRSMGDLYFDVGKYVEAIKAYTNAIDVDLNYAEAYFNRATAANNLGLEHQKNGDAEQALYVFEQGLADVNEALPLLLDANKQAAYQEALSARRSLENNLNQIRKRSRIPSQLSPAPESTNYAPNPDTEADIQEFRF